jgi:8-oxo-dGTP pyrophosphatase MutT (NUDIX family)/phosphohistidine phosphatase SixA
VPQPPPVVAAGAVVWRETAGGVQVLLVHRPTHDDWSFPKGKVDDGEHLLAAAVREVAEETGLIVRLGPPLPTRRYHASGFERPREVHYWAARPSAGDVSSYVANDEVDQLRWLPLQTARTRLSYPGDVELLDVLQRAPRGSEPLLVLRHGWAQPRREWSGEDKLRPLSAAGLRQARALASLLAAYGVSRVVSSDAIRCAETVRPFAESAGLRPELDATLSEEDAAPREVRSRVRGLFDASIPAVACTHRRVLPVVLEALGMPDPALPPGGFVVAHRAAGSVLAVEQHEALPAAR